MVLSYLEGVTKEKNAYSLLVKAHDEKMNQSLTWNSGDASIGLKKDCSNKIVLLNQRNNDPKFSKRYLFEIFSGHHWVYAKYSILLVRLCAFWIELKGKENLVSATRSG